jgi:hypothetical protein
MINLHSIFHTVAVWNKNHPDLIGILLITYLMLCVPTFIIVREERRLSSARKGTLYGWSAAWGTVAITLIWPISVCIIIFLACSKALIKFIKLLPTMKVKGTMPPRWM